MLDTAYPVMLPMNVRCERFFSIFGGSTMLTKVLAGLTIVACLALTAVGVGRVFLTDNSRPSQRTIGNDVEPTTSASTEEPCCPTDKVKKCCCDD